MLINTTRRSALWLFIPPILLLFVFLTSHHDKLVSTFQSGYSIEDLPIHSPTATHTSDLELEKQEQEKPLDSEDPIPGPGATGGEKESDKGKEGEESIQIPPPDAVAPTTPDQTTTAPREHRTVYSVSTSDKKYFRLDFLSQSALNPNIIPHPTEPNTWILAAQLLAPPSKSSSHSIWCAELTCNARFDVKAGSLRCVTEPMILPIAGTTSTLCKGEVELLSLSIGPHDARVFYGPDYPLAIWGSQSAYTCFGQWVVDFRVLVDWDWESRWAVDAFHTATELQRPGAWGGLEKNWFIFWDSKGEMYVHNDIAPKRVFAKLALDGSAVGGQDLAPLAATAPGGKDEICLKKYMPQLPPNVEGGTKHSIHQATNSLAITLCRRKDSPDCVRTEENTVIISIFHQKTWESTSFHSTYEPYVVVFHQTAPFALHSISQKPIWINGRSTEKKEMLYVTSMSWMQQGMKYHGFLDDVLFLAFGIEDKATGGIDIVAGELLRDLGLCADL